MNYSFQFFDVPHSSVVRDFRLPRLELVLRRSASCKSTTRGQSSNVILHLPQPLRGWFGHSEETGGPPSSLFDEIIDGIHCASAFPCDGWVPQEMADYLQGINVAGVTLGVDESASDARRSAILFERVTSPVSTTMRVDFALERSQAVWLSVYTADGRVAATLLDGRSFHPGRHQLAVRLPDLPSGAYFLNLATEWDDQTRRILILH